MPTKQSDASTKKKSSVTEKQAKTNENVNFLSLLWAASGGIRQKLRVISALVVVSLILYELALWFFSQPLPLNPEDIRMNDADINFVDDSPEEYEEIITPKNSGLTSRIVRHITKNGSDILNDTINTLLEKLKFSPDTRVETIQNVLTDILKSYLSPHGSIPGQLTKPNCTFFPAEKQLICDNVQDPTVFPGQR